MTVESKSKFSVNEATVAVAGTAVQLPDISVDILSEYSIRNASIAYHDDKFCIVFIIHGKESYNCIYICSPFGTVSHIFCEVHPGCKSHYSRCKCTPVFLYSYITDSFPAGISLLRTVL